MSKFGILGYGFVGKATHKGILNNSDSVIVHDILLNTNKNNLRSASTVFVCLPTNTDADIETMIQEILELQFLNPDVQIIIRSTLPLGACKKIQEKVGPIIYIPEFLRERFWDTDCLNRPLVVGHDMIELLPTWLKEEDIITCSTVEAEMLKMFSNNFAIVRIVFANMFYDLSNSLDVNYDTIKDMFFRVQPNQTYLEVPGHDGNQGFGGKCLPKDLDFFIETLDQHGLDSNWFKYIKLLNKTWKEKNNE